MDTSFGHISFNNGGNNSVLFQDQFDINTSPTQQLNYIKPNQQHHTNNLQSNNGIQNGGLQRKSSLLYQHYTNNTNSGSRMISEAESNLHMGTEYYHGGDQSFSNMAEENNFANNGNVTSDAAFWNSNTSLNHSPVQQNVSSQQIKNGKTMSYRNITAPVFNNISASNGYGGYSPSVAMPSVSGTLQRGSKSPVANNQSTIGTNGNSSLQRAISIKNSVLTSSTDSPTKLGDKLDGSLVLSKKSATYQPTLANTAESFREDEDKNFQMELKLKDSQIESLEQEIENLKKMIKLNTSGTLKSERENQKVLAGINNQKNDTSHNNNSGKDLLDVKNIDAIDDYQDGFFFQLAKRNVNSLDDELYLFPEIPNSINELILRLSKKNEANNSKIKDLETRLDSIITAIMMNPMNTNGNVNILNNIPTEYGRYDEEAIAHKLIVRLETLTKENEEMGKMLSYGRSKEYQIEIKLLRRENEILKAKINELKAST